ncbi:MAG: hypothetical protein ACHP93_04000 [Solirubrobacterales bacterium]
MSESVIAAGPTQASAVARRASLPGRVLPTWTITAVLGAGALAAAPPSADLAAASYRSDLFGRAGFTLWDNGWYGGHHIPAYSLLAPALGWLIGPRLLAVVSMTIAAALFAALIEGRFPARATRIAATWLALGAAIALLSWRVAFDLGLAVGMGALLLAQRDRRAPALALAALCAFASPVAGAFLALAAIAWAAARRRGWLPIQLAVAALAPIGLLGLVFPEGGTQPFAASSFYPALAGVLLIAVLIPSDRSGAHSQEGAVGQRVLRVGTLLYAVALTGAYVLATPVGGNADRLGALLAGPIAACVLAGAPLKGRAAARWRGRVLVALAPFLLYWQANAPVADFASAASDPAVHASYYTPLLHELQRLGIGYSARPARIEVVSTVDHWEARFLAAHVPIARGWERQLDTERDALFYAGSAALTASRYRAWLLQDAVSYVALPDSRLDYSAKSEATLLQGTPPPYLREVWRSPHWRLFAVLGAPALAQPPAVVTRLGSDSFTLQTPRAGTFTVRVRFTPYWALASGHGCVQRAPGDWTLLRAPSGGIMRVVVDFTLARVFDHGARCR